MQKKLKILFISSEVAPFAKTGGLADVSGSLPKVLKDLNHDVRIFLPKYESISERKYVLREVIRLKEINVPVGSKLVTANVKSSFLPNSKVQVYFVGNKEYFNRSGLYCDPKTNKEWPDNAERFIFFSRSTLEILKKLHWQPDIIHCNEWHTALVPLYLKTLYKDDSFFNETKTLLSLHNVAFQGIFDKSVKPLLGIPDDQFDYDQAIEHHGKINFLKAGIINADLLSAVSKTYAKEIQTSAEYGFGLQDILRKRAKDLYGIVNGIDDTVWNPEHDKLIPYNYSSKDLSGKLANKKALVESQGLKFDENIAVIGTISRLTDQKGFDLIVESMAKIMELPVQYIVLGTGDIKYHRFFEKMMKKYPDKIAVNLTFDDKLAHQIEAGADMFLMPSKFEPCGLNQMYSLVYGTIPIVRATGGLADTVKNYSPDSGRGYGFVFEKYSAKALIETVTRAVKLFRNDKEIWKKLIDRAMKLDFSWKAASEKYLELYYKLVT